MSRPLTSWLKRRMSARLRAAHDPRTEPPMTRIDAHHHVSDLSARPHAWLEQTKMAPVRRTFTLDDLAEPAAAAGVTRTVLVQVVPDAQETREFLDLAAESDLVAGV